MEDRGVKMEWHRDLNGDFQFSGTVRKGDLVGIDLDGPMAHGLFDRLNNAADVLTVLSEFFRRGQGKSCYQENDDARSSY